MLCKGYSPDEIQGNEEFAAAILSGLKDSSSRVQKMATGLFLEMIKASQRPWAVLNKMDLVANFYQLLPLLERNKAEIFHEELDMVLK